MAATNDPRTRNSTLNVSRLKSFVGRYCPFIWYRIYTELAIKKIFMTVLYNEIYAHNKSTTQVVSNCADRETGGEGGRNLDSGCRILQCRDIVTWNWFRQRNVVDACWRLGWGYWTDGWGRQRSGRCSSLLKLSRCRWKDGPEECFRMAWRRRVRNRARGWFAGFSAGPEVYLGQDRETFRHRSCWDEYSLSVGYL